MRKRIVALLLALLLMSGGVRAEWAGDWLEATAAEPGWRTRYATRYGSGQWEGEMAIHAEVFQYRIGDGCLQARIRTTLVNPLREGDEVIWSDVMLAPIPLTPEAEERLQGLSAESIFDFGEGASLQEEQLAGCGTLLLQEGETLVQLMAFRRTLAGVAQDAQGRRSLRVVRREGEGWGEVAASPLSESWVWINRYHSWDDALEVYSDVELELWIVPDENDVWRLGTINTGHEVLAVEEEGLMDVTWGPYASSNASLWYSTPTFPTALTELDVTGLREDRAGLVEQLDATGWACVRADGTPMTDAPLGSVIATCYARAAGRIVAQREGYTQLLLGSAEHGLTGWFADADLAFGADTAQVRCGFPSHDDEPTERLDAVLPASLVAEEGDAATWQLWLIGRTPEGGWLVQAARSWVFEAPADAFTGVGEAEDE